MRDFSFGYCTNVHAGITLEQAKQNLESIATQVRQSVAPKGRLPVGLWLAEEAARQLDQPSARTELRQWLAEHGLMAYTFNGFPQGDFHQPIVKHRVYQPTWLEQSRLHYTMRLADILASLLDPGQAGSISTLPLGWPNQPWQAEDFRRAGHNLQLIAEHLDNLAQATGHDITLAIEPEPGCVLDTAPEITEFLNRYVYDDKRPLLRRTIGVCHDICHSAVMFESQADALATYRQAGVRVGKVQVSSAIEVPWQLYREDPATCAQTLHQLRGFHEPKYLHQTTRLSTSGEESPEMVDDLGLALQQWLPPAGWPSQSWRIHFHVPIYIERFGGLLATRDDIRQVVELMKRYHAERVEGASWFTGDYEVETYAWGVLPTELRAVELPVGIAQELTYFQSLVEPSLST